MPKGFRGGASAPPATHSPVLGDGFMTKKAIQRMIEDMTNEVGVRLVQAETGQRQMTAGPGGARQRHVGRCADAGWSVDSPVAAVDRGQCGSAWGRVSRTRFWVLLLRRRRRSRRWRRLSLRRLVGFWGSQSLWLAPLFLCACWFPGGKVNGEVCRC